MDISIFLINQSKPYLFFFIFWLTSFSVFIVNSEQISHIAQAFPLLSLNKLLPAILRANADIIIMMGSFFLKWINPFVTNQLTTKPLNTKL